MLSVTNMMQIFVTVKMSDFIFVFRVSLQLTHTLCVYLYVVSCKYALQTVLK